MTDQEPRPKALLALDLGTASGWMLRTPEGEKLSGAWKFPSGQPMGNRLLKLYQEVTKVIRENNCWDCDVRIAIEVAKFSKNPASQVLGTKLISVIELMASTYGWLPPTLVTVQEWRYPFLKFGGFLEKPQFVKRPVDPNLPKQERDRLDKANSKAATAWYKSKVIEQCQRLGMDPQTDDEADAIGVGLWFYDGGKDAQKQRMQKAAEKKKLKKAQTKMDL